MTIQHQEIDDPKERVRASARRLFAQKGFEATTTRDIAQDAGVNSASVSYYFGGKDKLAVEVFGEVLRSSADYRMERLAQLRRAAAASGKRLDIAGIVCSFVGGYFRDDAPGEGVLLATLLIKNRIAPTKWTAEIIEKELDGMARAYIEAIQEAVPEFDKQAANWRYNFMVGCVLISLVQKDAASRIQRLSDGLCSLDDQVKMRDEIVDFIVNGMYGFRQTKIE
jgi:AcrR family transcriptional regulator